MHFDDSNKVLFYVNAIFWKNLLFNFSCNHLLHSVTENAIVLLI